MERAFLFLGILCLVILTILLILWDGKPRKEPVSPTVPADLELPRE
ncbi:MAG TPA: hypothetical protein VFH59_09880 [Frateuria sp.]|nr:hypothetical protein [Frateuria sp.]HET6805736.1 hypothetical protein [Frateuria sp.]